MRKTIGIGLAGLLLAAGTAKLEAQVWVQTLNFALTAQVQTSDTTVKPFAISSKTLIEFLKGVTPQVTIENTIITTNAPIPLLRVTNSAFLPNAGHRTAAFPANFTITDYRVAFAGTNYTNHVSPNFANDIVLTQVPSDDTNLVEYQFANAVALDPTVTGYSTNATAFLFPTWPSAAAPNSVLAFLVTNAIVAGPGGTNTVFDLFGVTVTTTTTNGAGTPLPTTFATKNPRLIAKGQADSEDFGIFIRDGTKDYDVSQFFNYNPHLHEVHQPRGTSFTDSLDMSIDFNNGNDTVIQTEANGRQVRGPLPRQTGVFVKSVTATCIGGGTAAAPPAGQPVRPFPVGTMVVTGRVTLSGGKIENPTL
jgi:hypothetical protein